jgi:hypothetical protein
MKRLLLGLSLIANATLLVAGAYLALATRSPGRITTPQVEANLDATKAASSGAVVRAVSPSTPKDVSTNGLWESPADAQAWLASIKAPLDVRYAIARAMLDQKYRTPIKAARYPPDLKRWQQRHPPAELADRENDVRRQLEEEYKQLFGPDLARARYGEDTVAKSGLSPESWLEINRVARDYGQATMKLIRAGPMTPKERHLLNEEKNADLAKVLPPAEYEIYQAFHSPDADRLQRAMKGLDIDDEAYLRAFQAMDATKSPPPPTGSSVSLRPDEIRAIEQAVGPEVAAQIARNQDRGRPARPLSPAPPAARPSP